MNRRSDKKDVDVEDAKWLDRAAKDLDIEGTEQNPTEGRDTTGKNPEFASGATMGTTGSQAGYGSNAGEKITSKSRMS